METQHFWVTTSHQGEFKTLHVNDATTMDTSHENDIYGDLSERDKIENVCNLLKVMVLAAYPNAEGKHWYDSGKYKLPDKYKELIPQIKKIINEHKNKYKENI